MFFLGMLFLVFVLVRLSNPRHGFARMGCYNHSHRRRPVQLAPRSTPFERLKQRYVNGDLSDEQYEAELDELLRGGRTLDFGDVTPRPVAGARPL